MTSSKISQRGPHEILIRIILLALLTLTTKPSLGDVRPELEPDFARAVLAYNDRDYNRAVQILDNLMNQEPDTSEFIELKALILKTNLDVQGSTELYLNLIKLKNRQNRPPYEIAPYHFELGVIRLKNNQDREAQLHLTEAVKNGFNVVTGHFFLGQLALKAGHWAEAEVHFRKVTEGEVSDLKAPAHYYLGQVYAKLASPSNATQNFFSAQTIAKSQKDDPSLGEETRGIAAQIFKATQDALRPFDRSGFFGSVGFLPAYDSNVLAIGSGIPGVTAGSTTATGGATSKGTLMGNISYSSSPLATLQFVPGYRTSINLNANESTLNGEYFTHNLSLYITRKALAPANFGLKLEGSYILQDQATSSGSRNFAPYSLVGAFGPYLRAELRPKTSLNVEAYMAMQKYYADSTLSSTSTLKRSGNDYSVRVSIRNDLGNPFWNPGGWILFNWNNTEGTEFNSKGITAEFNNIIHFSEKFTATAAVDVGGAYYIRDPSAGRTDLIVTGDFAPSYRLSPKFMLLADVQYTNNWVYSTDTSAVGNYQYNRVVFSTGIMYLF